MSSVLRHRVRIIRQVLLDLPRWKGERACVAWQGEEERMSEVIECNYCGKRPRLCWLHVEWDGVDLSTFGEDPGPWDFCDMLCLSAWSFSKVEFEDKR